MLTTYSAWAGRSSCPASYITVTSTALRSAVSGSCRERSFKVLRLRRQKTFRAGAHRELVFRQAMRSTVFLPQSCTDVVKPRFQLIAALMRLDDYRPCLSKSSRNAKHACKAVKCSLTSNFRIPFGIHVGGEAEKNTRHERRIRQRPEMPSSAPKLSGMVSFKR